MLQSLVLPVLAGVATGLAGALAFILLYTRSQRRSATGILSVARQEADRLRADTQREAEAARAELLLSGKMETLKIREDLDREIQRRREEWERLERRADERTKAQERKLEEIDARERGTVHREEALTTREQSLRSREGEADRLAQEQRLKLERIAGLTSEDAKREIMQRVEDEARGQAAALVRDIKEQARRSADREARQIISMAIQRIAAEHTAETTVSAVALPSDEMKGRIIGREGRNIRAFEPATGVDVIIDDTPDTVVVSCFDPIRREVARLRAGGARSSTAASTRAASRRSWTRCRRRWRVMVETGEQAAYDTGRPRAPPRDDQADRAHAYRTRYGQNILDHSKEVAWLAGIMAGRAGLDVSAGQARRAAARRRQGAHPRAARGPTSSWAWKSPRKYGETAAVLNCIQAHHDEVPHESTESVLVAGRRRDQRLAARRAARGVRDLREAAEGLEEIANALHRGGAELRHPGRPRDAEWW